jgi:hypothetical protein
MTPVIASARDVELFLGISLKPAQDRTTRGGALLLVKDIGGAASRAGSVWQRRMRVTEISLAVSPGHCRRRAGRVGGVGYPVAARPTRVA